MECASCGGLLNAGETKCVYCGRPVVPEHPPRATVPRPEKYRVEDDGRQRTITWRWFHPAVFFLIPFCIAWNAFLVGWYSMAGGMGEQGVPGAMQLIFLVFPIGHVAVGIGLAYVVLAMLVNRTVIRTDRETLSIKHGPIYWPGVKLAVNEIDQLYCTLAESTNSDGDRNRGFSLRARMRDGSARTLIGQLQIRDDGLYLEQALEAALGIKDDSVPGEVT